MRFPFRAEDRCGNYPGAAEPYLQKSRCGCIFSKTIALIFDNRLKNAVKRRELCPDLDRIVISGGVAANRYLRSALEASSAREAQLSLRHHRIMHR